MTGILEYSGVKSDTINFRKYRQFVVEKLILENCVSPRKARTLSMLLEILESYRISFSKGAYRFQTKRVSTETIAKELRVTGRYVRMLLRILENAEIITIRRKRVGTCMNLWNAFEFSGFVVWLTSYAQSKRTPVPPKEENNHRLLYTQICFPTQNLTTSDRKHNFWRVLAFEVLPSGKQMPCLAQLSMRFRLNLRKLNIGNDHTSIIQRWKAFVKRALIFQDSVGFANGT